MKVTRRGFLSVAGSALLAPVPARADSADRPSDAGGRPPRAHDTEQTTSVCPYCAVGCGLVVSFRGDRVIGVEGDPEHPVNQGTLCSKGAALLQVANNERRLRNVMYRAPGSHRWEARSWSWALPRIARRIRDTRDATFRSRVNGRLVNRTEGIACLGGAALDNEECYLYTKLARALGIVYLEHQARI